MLTRSFIPRTLALGLCATATMASPALAERAHLVREGQTLARIAQRYEVPVGALAGANRLAITSSLHPGQTLIVPEKGVRYVAQGDTLASIAKSAGVAVADLAKANHLKERANLQIGRRLVLPGYAVPESAETKQSLGSVRLTMKGGKAVQTKKGTGGKPLVATFYRTATQQRARIRLLTRSGKVSPNARRQLAALMVPRGSKRTMLPHPRLVQLLAKVSERFEGKPIHIISGYRKAGGHTHKTSRHTMGRAMDLRIPGIGNGSLRDFCRRFDSVGVGYYPRSVFVHLDVRDKNAFWVDLSGPGEAPRYHRFKPWMENPEENAAVAEAETSPSDDRAIDEEAAAAVDRNEEAAAEAEGETGFTNVGPQPAQTARPTAPPVGTVLPRTQPRQGTPR